MTILGSVFKRQYLCSRIRNQVPNHVLDPELSFSEQKIYSEDLNTDCMSSETYIAFIPHIHIHLGQMINIREIISNQHETNLVPVFAIIDCMKGSPMC